MALTETLSSFCSPLTDMRHVAYTCPVFSALSFPVQTAAEAYTELLLDAKTCVHSPQVRGRLGREVYAYCQTTATADHQSG